MVILAAPIIRLPRGRGEMWRGGLWFSVLLEAPSARAEARAYARRRRRDAFIALLRDVLLVAE